MVIMSYILFKSLPLLIYFPFSSLYVQIHFVVERMEVFEWFKTHVIDKKPDPSIDHHELVCY
jgi:hypothetical protein